MQILLEKTYPYFVAASLTLAWWSAGVQLPVGTEILGSSLTIGAILTGFMATAKAILMSLDSAVMRQIRSTKYLDDVVSYLSEAIWLSFGFCGVALLGYFVNATGNLYGMAWIAVGVAMACAFIRVTNIMLKILRHPGNPNG